MTKRTKKKKTPKVPIKIAVIDFETDPFKYGRTPKAFAGGFYDGKTYVKFWGDNCVHELCAYIESLKTPHIIYAHNGGKFDFFYLLEANALQNPALLISNRIVKCQIGGKHELRDSFAILPLPLAKLGAKLDIDYEKMERHCRDQHREEIEVYLKADCVVLHELVLKFYERFNGALTVGSAAIKELNKLHPVYKLTRSHDRHFRPYYFGGRVSCFETGIINAPTGQTFKFFDVNSMYPKAMRDYDHPLGSHYLDLGADSNNQFNKRTGVLRGFGGMYFIRFIGSNKNALPIRDEKTGGLSFDQSYGEFFSTSHELKVALELGLVKIDEIINILVPCDYRRFETFVDKFGAEKRDAKLAGLTAEETFAKLMLNSAYGKFATDVDKFKSYFLFDTWDDNAETNFLEWKEQNESETNVATLQSDLGRFEIWACSAPDERAFFDVAVAASITGAARSILLRAIATSNRPIYCDTDSLLCLQINGVPISDTDLGAWKYEGETKRALIAGKKLYACKLEEIGKDGKPKIKLAAKGARLDYSDIEKICMGDAVEWRNDAPAFSLKKTLGEMGTQEIKVKFVQRKIKRVIKK